jgi:D-alanyl-D-alanine carboxypeptidase/D-alanyl-D-alanine-endopeptidase (penicillin-binding protein 4)
MKIHLPLTQAGIVSLMLFSHIGLSPDVLAAEPISTSAPTAATASTAETALWKSPLLQSATVGVEVAEVRPDGSLRTVYSHDAGRALMPASTLKLVSTATALRVCGAQTTVETCVGWTGTLTPEGILQGDVVIRGGGDATLASEWDARSPQTFVREAVQTLLRAGVRRVEGRVVGDGSLWSDAGVSPDWTWEDMGNYYAAGIYGLNYGANVYRLVLDTSRRGRQPRVLRTEPTVPRLTFDNRLAAAPCSYDSAYIYGAPHESVRRLEGAVPQRVATFTLRGDVPDPPLLAAAELRRSLVEAGIDVVGEVVSDYDLRAAGETVPRMTHEGYVYRSASIADMARRTNVWSQNLLAEMMLRLAADTLDAEGRTAGWKQRAGVVLDYWRRQGLDLQGVRMYDGCGLSPNDRVTPRFLTQLLARMRGEAAFVASLPRVGSEGTVRNFGTGTTLEGNARLKSGTTKQVVAYAGYVYGRGGRQWVVAVVVNNYEGTAAEVRRLVAAALAEWTRE